MHKTNWCFSRNSYRELQAAVIVKQNSYCTWLLPYKNPHYKFKKINIANFVFYGPIWYWFLNKVKRNFHLYENLNEICLTVPSCWHFLISSSIYQLLNQQKDKTFFNVTFSIPDFSPPRTWLCRPIKANVFSFENPSSALKIQMRIGVGL